MTRTYPITKDIWHSASYYAGKSFQTAGGTAWPEDVGDQFEAIQDYLGFSPDDENDSTIAGRMVAAELGYRQARSSYTPTLNGNGLTTTTSTWTGNYFRPGSGKIGLVSVTGAVTGNWAGSGFVSLSLPSGWTAQATHEAAVITGWCAPKPNIGVHVPLIGIVHAGDTEIRVISGQMGTDISPGAPGYVTATASTDLFACGTAHGLSAGDPVKFGAADATGAPAGVTIGTTYYVIASGLTSTAFKVSTSSGGSTINVTADGNVFASTVADGTQKYWFAVDGINTPFQFTGDGTAGNQDEIHLTGYVLLA